MAQQTTADLIGQIVEGLEPGSFCTRYVLVAEIISANGERAVWMDSHDDATRWDSYGLLMEALTREQAMQHAEARDDRDE